MSNFSLIVVRLCALFFSTLFCPFALADTIYLCDAYAGGTFWTNGLCSAQKAHINRIATVPGGMPFEQQVAFAQAQINAATQREQVPVPKQPTAPTTEQICLRLVKERRAIDQITEKMIWIPIEQQNANYYRMRQIKLDWARMGCRE